VAICLSAAALALRVPEAPRRADGEDHEDVGLLRGAAEALRSPGLRIAVAGVALLGGIDAIEEYFPLITEGLGVPTVAVPLAMLPIGLAGAFGATLGGPASRLRAGVLAAILGGGTLLLGLAGWIGHPAGVAAVALFYVAFHATLVVVDARLQERIESRSRATVTSVGGLGVEVATFAVYAAWALGELTAVVAVGLVFAAGLPWLLRAVTDPSRLSRGAPRCSARAAFRLRHQREAGDSQARHQPSQDDHSHPRLPQRHQKWGCSPRS
jgi:hypothetical protein